MQRLNRSSKAGREIKSATLVPKFQNKRKREASTVPPQQRTRRGSMRPGGSSRLSSVVTDLGEEREARQETAEPSNPRRSTRERSSVTYTEPEEHGDLDIELDERSGLRDQTPLFAREDDETEEITVKEEPMDDDDEMPLQTINNEPIEGVPHLPIRSEEELEAMRAGAAAAGHRTDLGTGLEDPEDGFVDHADGRRSVGSPDPREDTGLVGMEDVEEEDGKEFKPVTRLSYSGKPILPNASCEIECNEPTRYCHHRLLHLLAASGAHHRALAANRGPTQDFLSKSLALFPIDDQGRFWARIDAQSRNRRPKPDALDTELPKRGNQRDGPADRYSGHRRFRRKQVVSYTLGFFRQRYPWTVEPERIGSTFPFTKPNSGARQGIDSVVSRSHTLW